jgi:hypothetical protein
MMEPNLGDPAGGQQPAQTPNLDDPAGGQQPAQTPNLDDPAGGQQPAQILSLDDPAGGQQPARKAAPVAGGQQSVQNTASAELPLKTPPGLLKRGFSSFSLGVPAGGEQSVPKAVKVQPPGISKKQRPSTLIAEFSDGQQPETKALHMTPARLLSMSEYCYSEMRLIPLIELGVCPINRKGKGLNGANVMNLMMRWHKGSRNGGEDFQTYRYKPARCIEPDPDHLEAALVHTNKMAKIDERIRAVHDWKGTGLYGMIAKSHMWAALWGTCGRSIRAELKPDGALLVPPPDQPDFAFAEKYGVWCEVLRYQALRDHPDVVSELMLSENFDASSALPEDEMQLLIDVKDMQHEAASSQKPGEHEYDTIVRLITARPGNVWTNREILCRYNLAKVMGGAHIAFMSAYTSTWVDFTKITVPLKNLTALATLHDAAPWMKTVLWLFNYSSDDCEHMSMGRSIADNWIPETIKTMKQDIDRPELLKVEENIRNLFNAYTPNKLPMASPELVHKQRCRLVLGIGKRLISDMRCWREEFAKLEDKLRGKLGQGVGLGEHVSQLRAASSQTHDAVAISQNLPSEVDSKPSLAFDEEGEVLEDAANTARGMGLAVGSTCYLFRASRGMEKNMSGAIVSFEKKDVVVRWCGEDREGKAFEEEKAVPLAFVKKCDRKSKRVNDKPTDEAVVVGQQPEVKLPPGIEWNCYQTADLDSILQHSLIAFNQRLAIQRAPCHDDVSILEEPRILIAKVDFPPLALRIVPTGKTLTRCQKPKARSKTIVDWIVNVKGSAEEVFFKRSGQQPGLGTQEGSTLTLDLASFLVASTAAAAAYPAGCVKLECVQSGQLDIPVGHYSTQDTNFISSKKEKAVSGLNLEAKCLYWTNANAIGKGLAIAAPDDHGLDVV